MNFIETGNKYFDRGIFLLAIDYYQKGLSINPNHHMTLTNLCISYYEIEEYDKSINIANRIIFIDPNNQNALAYRGYSYHKLNNFSLAEIDYSSLIEIDPFDEFFYLYRSNVRRKQGKFLESDKDLKKYELLSDKSTVFFFTNDNDEIKDEDLDEFNLNKQRMDAILTGDPKNYEAHFNLGVAYTKIRAYQSAIEAYTKAMELFPGKVYKEALFNRLNAYFDNKQYLECLEDISLYEKEDSINPYLEELAQIISEERKGYIIKRSL